jgi:hypothetical protein
MLQASLFWVFLRRLEGLNKWKFPRSGASVARLCLFIEEACCFHVFEKNKLVMASL